MQANEKFSLSAWFTLVATLFSTMMLIGGLVTGEYWQTLAGGVMLLSICSRYFDWQNRRADNGDGGADGGCGGGADGGCGGGGGGE